MKKITLILLFTLIISFIGCKDNELPKTAAQLKMELVVQENNNPIKHLKLEKVVMKKNEIKKARLFSSAKYDGHLITGQVVNTASIAKFKDLKVNVELYSKTNTVIDNKTYVFYEFYEPNSTNDFSIKIDVPDTMYSFDVSITGATPVLY